MRKILFLLFIVTFSFTGRTFAQVYARGSFSGWDTSYRMTSDGTNLQAPCVYVPAGINEFKFANNDFSLEWGDSIVSWSEYTSYGWAATDGGNIDDSFFSSGYYNFSFDSSSLSFSVDYVGYTASNSIMFASGDFNSWGTANRMELTGNHLWTTISPVYLSDSAHTMKFRNTIGWTGTDWGAATGLTGTASVTTGGGSNITFYIADSGNYNISFNDSTLVYSVEYSEYGGMVPDTGLVVSTNPAPVVDSTESVVIHFHPYHDSFGATLGDATLRNYTGTIFIYTGLLTNPSTGGWNHTNPTWAASDSYYAMTKVDSDDYTYTISDLRTFYGIGADTTIDSIPLIFKDSLGLIQSSNFYVPVTHAATVAPVVADTVVISGPIVSTDPGTVEDSTEGLTIHFHPYADTLYGTGGDYSLRSFSGTMFIYTGLLTHPATGGWNHTNPTWAAEGSYYAMTKVDSNDYAYSISDLRSFYGIGADSTIDSIAIIFKDSLGTVQTSNFYIPVAPSSIDTAVTAPVTTYTVGGPVVSVSPAPIIDSFESVTITFHPYWDTLYGHPGDTLFRHTIGDVYIYTGVLPHPTPGAGDWIHTNTSGWGASDAYYRMTKVDSNTYTYTFPDLRSYYSLAATDTAIDSLALIFTSGNGDTQTSNIFIPVTASSLDTTVIVTATPTVTVTIPGPIVTTNPSPVIDSTESLVIHFHPYADTLGGTAGDSTLRSFSGTMFVYTGLLTNPATGGWNHTNPTWPATGSYYAMTRIDSNDYTYTLPDIRSFYGIGTDSTIDSIAIIFKDSLGTVQTSNFFIPVSPSIASSAIASTGPVVTTDPAPVMDTTESVTITFHPFWDTLAVHSGDSLFRHTASDIYIYTGVLTDPSAGGWDHTNATGWGASDPYYRMTRIDSNTYTYTIPDLRAYYSLSGTDSLIDSIAVIFTSGNGDTQTANIFIPVSQVPSVTPVGGPIVATDPLPVTDSTETVTITFHPYWDTLNGHSGDTLFRHTAGDIYLYTGVLPDPTPGPGYWIHTNTSGWGASDPYYKMTRVDSNTYTYTFPDLRSYYALAGTDTLIDSIALIFTSGNGDTQTSNVFIPVAPAILPPPSVGIAVTTDPAVVTDSVEGIVITFHPFWDTLADHAGHSGDTLFRSASYPLYIYTGILPSPTPGPGVWTHTNTSGWGASDPVYRMTELDSNTYNYAIPDVRSYYGVAGTDTLIDSIAVIVTNGSGSQQTSNFFIPVRHEAVTPTGVAGVTTYYNKLTMQLVPNPARNEVAANVLIDNNAASATISVFNELGVCVLSKTIDRNTTQVILPISNFTNGIYFVQMEAGVNKVVQRLIKQ